MRSGFFSSEFWFGILAHFAPMLAAYFMNSFAPGNPIATAAVAIVSAAASQYGSVQYTEARTALKGSPAASPAPAPAAPAPVAGPTLVK